MKNLTATLKSLYRSINIPWFTCLSMLQFPRSFSYFDLWDFGSWSLTFQGNWESEVLELDVREFEMRTPPLILTFNKKNAVPLFECSYVRNVFCCCCPIFAYPEKFLLSSRSVTSVDIFEAAKRVFAKTKLVSLSINKYSSRSVLVPDFSIALKPFLFLDNSLNDFVAPLRHLVNDSLTTWFLWAQNGYSWDLEQVPNKSPLLLCRKRALESVQSSSTKKISSKCCCDEPFL